MRNEQMQEKVKDILSEVLKLEESTSNITEDMNLIELGLNSLNAIEIVVYLEEAFDIQIDDEDLMIEYLASLKQICDLLKRYGVEE